MVVQDSLAVFVVERPEYFAAEADKLVVAEQFVGSFAEHGLELGLALVPEPVFSLKFDIVVEHTFVVVECKSAVAACNSDFRK